MNPTNDRAFHKSRRSVLSGLAAWGFLLGCNSGNAQAGQGEDIHVQIAARAKRDFPQQKRPLRVLFPQGAGANLEPVIQAFEQLSGLKVEAFEVGIDMVNADLMLDAMLGEGRFDVALPATYALPDLIAAKAIIPVEALGEKYKPLLKGRSSLYDIGNRYAEQRYGFQTDGDSYLLFLNQNWLRDPDQQARYGDQTGDSLAVPKTWEELDRQMAFFHDSDAERFGGNLFRTPGYQTWEWWLRFHGKGLWPFAADMSAQIDSDAGIEALEDMIRASEWLHPRSYVEGVFDNADRFSQGNIYCTLGWGGSQKRLNAPHSKMRDQMVFAQPPGGIIGGQAVQASYFNWGWSYVLTSTSDCSDLGYLFSLFATTPAMATLAVRQVDGFFDPFLAEHYEDPGIIQAYSKPFLAAQKKGLEQAIPDLYLQGQTLYLQSLGNSINHALNGRATPQEALRHVARDWELITTRIGREVQQQGWADLKAQYPPAFQAGLRDIARPPMQSPSN